MSLTQEFFNRTTNITAKVICDSINGARQRITTFQIESNPAIPLYWGKAKSGMQAGDEIENVQKAEWIWSEAYLEAKECVGGLVEYCNLHKQTANRL